MRKENRIGSAVNFVLILCCLRKFVGTMEVKELEHIPARLKHIVGALNNIDKSDPDRVFFHQIDPRIPPGFFGLAVRGYTKHFLKLHYFRISRNYELNN